MENGFAAIFHLAQGHRWRSSWFYDSGIRKTQKKSVGCTGFSVLVLQE